MKRSWLLLIFLPMFAQAQVTLQPWVEVFGTVNGQQLGKYVTGITPSANLPYKAAVSKVGSTGIYRLNTPNDTSALKIFLGENLLTGDLNNDGFRDVVISKTVNNDDTVYVYWGTGTGIDTLNPLKIPGENQFDGLRPGCIGDINNDGKPDLILTAVNFPNLGGNGKVYVFKNPVNSSTPTATLMGDTSFHLGVKCCVGDVNNDGLRDLILRGSKTGGSSYNYINIYWGIGADTINLMLGLQMKTTSIVTPGLASFDVNGDGKDDLLWTTADSTGQLHVNVHYGRTGFQTSPDLQLVRPFPMANFGYTLGDAGDMNGDGYHDIIVGCPAANISSGFVVEYSGGPRVDPLFDAAVGKDWDGYFGGSVASIGDVNGDGLSDIIVGAPQYAFGNNKGYWGIFKGDTTIRVTDVLQQPTPLLEFKLLNAYPNPFNPTVTIPFSLQSSARVSIEISDQLGRSVRTLIDQEYSPGYNSIQFDASGLASGVYYYRMTAKKNGSTVFQQTKHITLLK